MTIFSTGEFFQGFILEASEHLSNITRILFSLEQAGEDVERHELLNDLFRSFHTLKGLCGMVGLQEGARLSHGMETIIQALIKGELTLRPGVIDALLSGAHTLSDIVEVVRRAGQPALGQDLSGLATPDIQPDLELFSSLFRQPEPPQEDQRLSPGEGEPAQTSVTQHHWLDATLNRALAGYPALIESLGESEKHKILISAQAEQWFAVVLFSPSQERAAKEENVDRLRQQLQQAGTLIKGVPVMAEGKIRFQFLVSSPKPLETDGLIADEVVPLLIHVSRTAPVTTGFQGTPAASAVVRVDLARLDELMRFAGDLVMQRARLTERLEHMEGISPVIRRELNQLNQQMGRTLRDLRRSILRARMVPLAEAFNYMPLVVRDLARASQKDVHLTITGEKIEVDKLLVERLLDPLIHLVRNAITHGIETPNERASANKPPQGSLTLRGLPAGDHIFVEVSDDGRGVDLQRVATKAQSLGWIEPGRMISADDALDFITRPGFSTQNSADLASGRGVGLDVVTRLVNSFGGQLMLETVPGKGSTFRMRLPLTLVIQEVLLVKEGAERYAVPSDMIERIIEIDPDKVVRLEGGELLPGQEGYSVLFRLADFAYKGRENSSLTPHPRRLFGLVSALDNLSHAVHEDQAEQGRPVLLVEQVLALREVVVQPLSDPLVAQPGLGGATELGDGQVVLILDLPALVRRGRRSRVEQSG